MGVAVPFQETVAQVMCVDCPVAEIPDQYWQQNIHEGIVYDPQHLHEILGIFRHEAQAMHPDGLAQKLNSVHIHLLNLFPVNTEEDRFEAVPGSESVLLRRGGQNPVAEQDLPLPARMFLQIMRIADDAGSSALREYIDTHARDHQGVIDRVVILAAALFLRDRQE